MCFGSRSVGNPASNEVITAIIFLKTFRNLRPCNLNSFLGWEFNFEGLCIKGQTTLIEIMRCGSAATARLGCGIPKGVLKDFIGRVANLLRRN